MAVKDKRVYVNPGVPGQAKVQEDFDKQFKDNPLYRVDRQPHFYAGQWVASVDGYRVVYKPLKNHEGRPSYRPWQFG